MQIILFLFAILWYIKIIKTTKITKKVQNGRKCIKPIEEIIKENIN